ncbi:MAG TPA: nuclease-related domain-containing protein [Woeseiaceae bacterium]|nr:nuclease-related domain-containing protein [Woeseiaceae bacterium]
MIRRLLSFTIPSCLAASAAADELAAVAPAGDVATGVSLSLVSASVIVVACLLLLLLLVRGSAARIRRAIGERRGRRRLRRVLRRRSPDLLENLIIPGAYGGLTKIDCAVLTSGGILCIQVKHCDGIVFGSEKEPQWKNVEGVRQRKFLNPVIQNAGRTKALQNVVPEVPVASLVVFTGPAQLTAPKVRNAVRLRDLDSYIAKFVFGPCRIKDWDGVWFTVKSAALTDEDSARDFRAQLSFS